MMTNMNLNEVSELLRSMNYMNNNAKPYYIPKQEQTQMSALTPTGAFRGGTLQRDPYSRNYQFSEEDLIRRKKVREERLEERKKYLQGLRQRAMLNASLEENVLKGIPQINYSNPAFNQDLRIT